MHLGGLYLEDLVTILHDQFEFDIYSLLVISNVKFYLVMENNEFVFLIFKNVPVGAEFTSVG